MLDNPIMLLVRQVSIGFLHFTLQFYILIFAFSTALRPYHIGQAPQNALILGEPYRGPFFET